MNAAAGECYFATNDATVQLVHGNLNGIPIPFTPIDLEDKQWTGSSVCRPGAVAENPEGPQVCPCNNSPIILDLGHDGYRLTSMEDGVEFDLRNDGTKRRTAWTRAGAENAFLALDRNGDGRIDNGSELFGDATPLHSGQLTENGFIALAEFDSNADGVIDAADGIWPVLLLWTDRNHDGISASNEIRRIVGSSVIALETDHHAIGRTDPWGNLYRYQSHFHVAGGRRNDYDVFLRNE